MHFPTIDQCARGGRFSPRPRSRAVYATTYMRLDYVDLLLIVEVATKRVMHVPHASGYSTSYRSPLRRVRSYILHPANHLRYARALCVDDSRNLESDASTTADMNSPYSGRPSQAAPLDHDGDANTTVLRNQRPPYSTAHINRASSDLLGALSTSQSAAHQIPPRCVTVS